MKKHWLIALLLLVPSVALGQCPPLCGPNYDVPIHFTVPDVTINKDDYAGVPWDIEAYEAKNILNIVIHDTNVYEIVGLQKGPGIAGTCFDNYGQGFKIDFDYNGNIGTHRIRIENWCTSHCDDQLKGDYYIYSTQEPGDPWYPYREIFRDVFRVIVYGKNTGTVTLDVDDDCTGEGGPEGIQSTSWVTHFPQNQCLTSTSTGYVQDPDNLCYGGSVKTTYGPIDFVEAVTAGSINDSKVTVQLPPPPGRCPPDCEEIEKARPSLAERFPGTIWKPGITSERVLNSNWDKVKKLYQED